MVFFDVVMLVKMKEKNVHIKLYCCKTIFFYSAYHHHYKSCMFAEEFFFVWGHYVRSVTWHVQCFPGVVSRLRNCFHQ